MTIKITISVTDGADKVQMKVTDPGDVVNNAESRVLESGQCHSVYIWGGRKIELEEIKNDGELEEIKNDGELEEIKNDGPQA